VYPVLSEADTLKITSNPPGATVEIDRVLAGTIPFEKDFPRGYFHVMVIKSAGLADWKRTPEILKDSQVALKPVLDRAP